MALTGIGDGLAFSKTATASTAYTANDFTITRALTQGSNSSSGSAILKVEDTSNASSEFVGRHFAAEPKQRLG
ncbi:MAG: hypothetical protein WDN27_03845 [Candidatus Saccharibacteria bacterium]